MEKAVIKFNDGTELEVEVNGSSFIVDAKPDFPSDLTNITVTKEDTVDTFTYAELVECFSIDGRYWFSFIEIPEQERLMKENTAKIEYIAMMSDIDLEG